MNMPLPLWVCHPWLSGESPSPVVSVSPSRQPVPVLRHVRWIRSLSCSSDHPGCALCTPALSTDLKKTRDGASLVALMVKNPPAMQETGVWSLEKEMATHSSIFAWEIPWTEEPGRLSKGRTRLSDWHCEWQLTPSAVRGSFLPVPFVYPIPSLPGSSRTFAATLICRSSPFSLTLVLFDTQHGRACIHLIPWGHTPQWPTRNTDPTLSWILVCDVFALFASESSKLPIIVIKF